MNTKVVTTADLIRQAGATITRYQLERWLKAGLLPAPHRRGLGRGKGTVSEYPAIAVPMVKRLVELSKQTRDIHAWRWQLWLDGYPIDQERLQLDLVRHLEAMQAEIDKRAPQPNSDELTVIETLFDEMMRSRPNPMLRHVRSRVESADYLQSLFVWAMSLAFGFKTPVGWSEPLDDNGPTIEELVSQIVGLPVQDDATPSVDPTKWLSLPVMRDALSTASEREWRTVRRDWQAISGAIETLRAVDRVQPLPLPGKLAIDLVRKPHMQAMLTGLLIEVRRSPLAGNVEIVMATLRGLAAILPRSAIRQT